MEDFLQQIEKALEQNLYYLALQATLTLPDICSSLLSNNPTTRKVGEEYKNWYNNNFSSSVNLSAEDCYYFRCSMLHQFQTQHNKSNIKRIMFIEPNHPASDMLYNISFQTTEDEKMSLNIKLKDFCEDMISSVRYWWVNNQTNQIVIDNYKNIVKRYPNGLKPYIGGVPIIS